MSGPVSKLRLTYLVGGAPGRDGTLAAGSLRLLTDCLFSRRAHRSVSIIGTDERGALYTYDEKLERKRPVQLPPKESLELTPIPPSVVRQSYIVFEAQWQAELLAHLSRVGFARAIRTLPVAFTAKHLRAPEAGDEGAAKAHRALESQPSLAGQLIPQLRVLVVLLEEQVSSRPPETLSARIGDRKLALARLGSPIALELGAGKRSSFVAYCLAAPALPEGRYVVSIPAHSLKPRFQRGPTARSFEVAFGVRTFAGDFDIHLFEFPSVESVILTHFADFFPHLTEPHESSPGSAAPPPLFAAAEKQTSRARVMRTFDASRTRLTTGFQQVRAIVGLPDVFKGALEQATKANPLATKTQVYARAGAKAAAKVSGAPGVGVLRTQAREMLGANGEQGARGAAALALGAWEAYDAIEETLSTWKKLRITNENAKLLGLVRQAVDAKGIRKLYKTSKWQAHAIDMLAEHAGGEKNELARYLLWRREAAMPEVIARVTRKSLEPRVAEYQKTVASTVVRKALWVLETSADLRAVALTAYELGELRADEKHGRSRLLTYLEEYRERYATRPCLAAIPRLEVARRVADEGAAASDEKTKELIAAAFKLVTGALVMVPVIGEFALLAQVGDAAYDAVGAVIEQTTDAIDRYIWRHKSTRSRMAELYRIHAQQVRALHEAGWQETDAHVQLRMRVMAIVGLLGLVERCGSRRDTNRFTEKVAQYRVGEYVKTFFTSSRAMRFPVSAGTPFDEMWLYLQGNRHTGWNEMLLSADSEAFANTVSPGKTIFPEHDYHQSFPCYGMDSSSPEHLVRAFSRNFQAIIDKDLVFTAAYVRRTSQDSWVPPSRADWKIGPFTPVRVVAVFRSKEDLTGTPVSLQLKRADRSYDGPVYKSLLARASATQDGGADKGLLPKTAEAAFIDDPNAYACVFFPFYFYRTNYVDGLKPFGHLALSADMNMELKLDLKVGVEGARTIQIEDGKKTIALHLWKARPPGTPVSAATAEADKIRQQMFLDSDFMNHKASGQYAKRLFVEGEAWVAGVFVQGKSAKVWVPGNRREAPVLTAGEAFRFSWKDPLDIVFVIFGTGAGVRNYPEDPIKFPTALSLHIDDDDGPTYSTNFFSLGGKDPLRETTVAKIGVMLAKAKIDIGTIDDRTKVDFGTFGSIFATRFSPEFCVTGRNGKMLTKRRLKPFGSSFNSDKTYEAGHEFSGPGYRYRISISSDPVGLRIRNAADLRLPGIPPSLFNDTAFAEDPTVVTDKSQWKSTTLEKLRF